MDELVPYTEEGKQRYRWQPHAGKKYWLGYQHGRVAGIGMTGQESVYAHYFGTRTETLWTKGKANCFVFYRQEGERIFEYLSRSNEPTHWMSDGEDEPSIPYVAAWFSRELTEDTPANRFIRERLGTLDKKVA
jgi:hypothetical protein